MDGCYCCQKQVYCTFCPTHIMLTLPVDFKDQRLRGFLFLDLTVHGSCTGVALSENFMNLINQLGGIPWRF